MIPYRRRDFEAAAMIKEIIRRAREHDCSWGVVPREKKIFVESLRKIYFIYDPETGVDAYQDLKDSLGELCKHSKCQGSNGVSAFKTGGFEEEYDSVNNATHAIVILSDGILRGKTLDKLRNLLQESVFKSRNRDIAYLYINEKDRSNRKRRWYFETDKNDDWRKLCNSAQQSDKAIRDSIYGHECMIYRPKKPSKLKYEHDAMAKELLLRL